MANKPISDLALSDYLADALEIEEKTGQLTVEACMKAWGYTSKSATLYAMRIMVERGLLVTFPRGKFTTYRVAKEPQ